MGCGGALSPTYIPQAPCDDTQSGAMPGGYIRRHNRHAVPGSGVVCFRTVLCRLTQNCLQPLIAGWGVDLQEWRRGANFAHVLPAHGLWCSQCRGYANKCPIYGGGAVLLTVLAQDGSHIGPVMQYLTSRWVAGGYYGPLIYRRHRVMIPNRGRCPAATFAATIDMQRLAPKLCV